MAPDRQPLEGFRTTLAQFMPNDEEVGPIHYPIELDSRMRGASPQHPNEQPEGSGQPWTNNLSLIRLSAKCPMGQIGQTNVRL